MNKYVGKSTPLNSKRLLVKFEKNILVVYVLPHPVHHGSLTFEDVSVNKCFLLRRL